MKLVFLGTGGTYPSRVRNVTSIAVQMPSEVLMFDCGEGTQRQLMGSSVSFMRISRIFITHLHADHFLGLPGLIQSMSLNGREDELTIYGPEGMEGTVRALLGLGYFKSGFEVMGKDLEGGDVLDFGRYVVSAVEADHTVPALAFALEEKPRPGRFDLRKAKRLGIPEGPMYRRLQEGRSVSVRGKTFMPSDVLGPPRRGRKVVYSGDTKPSRDIIALAKDADVLIHDCTLESAHGQLASTFGHSTAAQAASVAVEAGVGRLFLVHLSPRYDEPDLLEREARSIFKYSEVPAELSEYTVKYRD